MSLARASHPMWRWWQSRRASCDHAGGGHAAIRYSAPGKRRGRYPCVSFLCGEQAGEMPSWCHRYVRGYPRVLRFADHVAVPPRQGESTCDDLAFHSASPGCHTNPDCRLHAESERVARHEYDRLLARRGCALDVKHGAVRIEASVQPLLAARFEEGPHAAKRADYAISLIMQPLALRTRQPLALRMRQPLFFVWTLASIYLPSAVPGISDLKYQSKIQPAKYAYHIAYSQI